ncbi:MAG: DUF4402 domain-containing protein [Pseudomonadota bacterium]
MEKFGDLTDRTLKKNSNIIKAGCVLLPLTFLPQPAHAMITIAISATEVLHFGSFAVNGTGAITINTAGARSSTGGITLIPGGGLESQGAVSISGSTGLAIDLSMVGTSFVISNGADTMTVNNFNVVSDGGGVSETITLTTTPQTFAIGARLNVTNPAQPDGTYIGNYNISANYQ